MESLTSPSTGQSILLSAGPRAGKTTLLRRWRDGATGPAQYLKITAEDRVSGFLVRRFLSAWPEIGARYRGLREALPETTWGGLLGLAIAETHPDFSLFLDDFHLAEAMPDAADWTALIRHFPEGGTLVVASRHLLPEFGRPSCERVGADDPRWHEAPDRSDLMSLPPGTCNRLLALHAIGEGTPCVEDDELVRRNLAVREESGMVRLREAWRPIAREALAFCDVAPEVWRSLEGELRAFRLRHCGSRHEENLPDILERIPSAVRRERSALMALEGLLCQRAHRFEQARACHQRALALAETLEERQEALLGLMDAAARLRDEEAFAALHATLRREAPPDDHALEARMLYSLGRFHWFGGCANEAAEAMKAILTCPTEGNRQTIHAHAQALAHLAIHQLEFQHVARAPGYAERYIHLCEAYGFDRNLLHAYGLPLLDMMLDEANPPSLGKIVAMPLKAFQTAQPDALCSYLLMFGIRSLSTGRYHAAKRNFELVLTFADSRRRDEAPLVARYWLMLAHGALKETDRVRDHYEALCAARGRTHFMENVQLAWIRSRIGALELDEAARLLATFPWTIPDNQRRAALYRHWIAHRRGLPDAAEAALAVVQSEGGAFLWHNEAHLLQELGLRATSPLFHLSTFGETTFGRAGAGDLRWPRKKALSLLAHLALAPDGIEQPDLIERLYEGSSTYDPASALNKLTYDLRKVLGSVEADTLLSINRRTYRLDWDRVAHCDLHAFDALGAKGAALEASDLHELAGIFYWMALQEAPGALFEDLDDPAFDAPRREYDARRSRMNTFVEAYVSPLIPQALLVNALTFVNGLFAALAPVSTLAA
ncbi:MAG TPA: hypothetical protein V6D00_09940 [Pantanalinema sp.]